MDPAPQHREQSGLPGSLEGGGEGLDVVWGQLGPPVCIGQGSPAGAQPLHPALPEHQGTHRMKSQAFPLPLTAH